MLVGGWQVVRRNVTAALIVTGALCSTTDRAWAGLGSRHLDPGQVVPLHEVAPDRRDAVAEVIREHTFHRQGETDAFPCAPSLYLGLLNEPAVTLALWKDLSDSPVSLQKVAPNRYEGTDGSGSTAAWEFVLRSPRRHVMLAYFNFVSPHGNARIDARIVLVVNTNYYRDGSREPWVQHNVDAFVKVDSKGWKTLARTLRPVIERILEEQVREAGYFVSLMTRLVITYPAWASQVVAGQPAIDAPTRQRFCELVARTRKPGASDGRPVVVHNAPSAPNAHRR
jgi:hypothetical protein